MRHLVLAAGTLSALSGLALSGCGGPSTEESARRTGEIRLENATAGDALKQAEAARGKNRIEPGQWEDSFELVSMDLPGVPEGPLRDQMMAQAGKPRVVRACKKADDKAIDPGALSSEQRNCRFPKYEVAGGRIAAEMECQGPLGTIRMSLAGTQSPTAYDVTMTQRQKMPGGSQESTTVFRVTGKRVGDCAA